MPMAHVCEWCGCGLSRVRPVHDPGLDLRVVVCPECGRGAIRRRHPLVAFLRTIVRLNAAVERLVLQLAAVGLFGTMMIVGIVLTIETSGRTWRDPRSDEFFFIWFYGVVPVALGTWLFAAFAHQRFLRVWLIWPVILYGVMALGSAIVSFTEVASQRWGDPFRVRWSREFHDAPWRAFLAALLLGAMMVMALAGIPLGLFARWSARRFRAWRFGFRRRRKRMEAHSA